MKTKHIALCILLVLGFTGCINKSSNKSNAKQATIYVNGDIITMEGTSEQYAEVIVEQNGKIVFVGSKNEAYQLYSNSKSHDLEGKTLIPGLIEPHLHPSIAAVMLQNEIIAPYDWRLPSGIKKGVQGEADYRKRITESIDNNAKRDKIYFIWGYHQLWHGELSRTILNDIAKDKPVGIIHRSFHEIFLNDAAITKLGIQASDFEGNPQVLWEEGHFF